MDGNQWLQVSEVRRCLTSPLQASGVESWQALESPGPWASDSSHTLEAHSRESPGLSQIYKCSSFVCRGDARVYMFTSVFHFTTCGLSWAARLRTRGRRPLGPLRPPACQSVRDSKHSTHLHHCHVAMRASPLPASNLPATALYEASLAQQACRAGITSSSSGI